MADGSLDAEVVIVGGGIAGLATAVALQRAGVAPGGSGIVVLERHPELRATGTAMTVFPNGWFALRAFGVADKLVKTDRYAISPDRLLCSPATEKTPSRTLLLLPKK
ncbi:6-hydroxynicotinate 3-monooxygenase-like [Hordeum vulgare]|nr:6-hydroxynicotinate 3-monooxygenase-like [Hordeum vulgare]